MRANGVHDALRIRDEVAFFQTVRAALVKSTPPVGKAKDDLDVAIRQIVSKAVASDEVVDVFAAAGLKKPDISILSDEFLEDIRQLPYRNLAAELLQKLLSDEIKTRQRKHLVQSREFSEMLAEAIRKYQNRSIEAAQVITQLIELAKQMREAHHRGELTTNWPSMTLSKSTIVPSRCSGTRTSASSPANSWTRCART